ncbi:TonB-dependent receptor family protein [Prevotella herbatica]|uniref:TonB-dependent receptor family protein n=2 Tax=Prevotella herbatica TaxID=2801997 RepID=A0ABN6EFP4_9BACT|nr:TonB-dependent receptor family protein [Prevotella herbatica]
MIMRKTIIILLCALSLHLSAQRVNLHYNNTPISAILKQLNSEQHNYAINFIYNELEDFHVTTDIKNKTIPDAIRQMIGFYPIKMTTMDENILLVECIQKAALHYKGRIIDEHGQSLEFANITLLSPTDSTIIGNGVSNEDGYFVIPCESQKVIARISYVGYKTIKRTFTNPNMGLTKLEPSQMMVKGVVVKGHLITRSAEGLTVNIEKSPLADIGYASDVLKHLPLVTLKNDVYGVLGKGTPLIYINNRLVYDNTELKQLNSSEIKNVKVIINPGAEYDATVNSVIRISTIKAKGDGLSGIVDGNLSAERVLSHQAGGTLNYRKNGLDIFGSARYYRNMLSANQTMDSHNGDWENSDKLKLKGRNLTLLTTLGTNYQWNSRSSVGLRYQFTDTPSNHFNAFDDLEGQHLGIVTYRASSQDYRQRTSKRHYVNAYLDYGFNDDSYLKLDMDYLNGNSNDKQDYNISQSNLSSHNNAKNKLYAGRLIFVSPLLGGNVKTGMEASYTNNNNNYKVVDGATVQNDLHSTTNKANQQLYAGFLEYNKSWNEHWSANIGFRYEYTNFNYYVDAIKSPEASQSYGGFFPSGSIAYNIGNVDISLAYRYTTQRPSYFQLRNAVAINSPYSYEGGNPELQPSKTNMLTLTLAWKDLQFVSTYATIKDGISFIYDHYETNDSIAFFQTRNMDRRYMNFSANYSPTLFKIWKPELQVNFTKPFVSYNGQRYNKPNWYFEMDNLLKLSTSFNVGCEIDYTTAGHTDNGVRYYYANSYAELYFVKTFLNNRLRLNLSVTNIFNTSREKWQIDTNGVISNKWNDNDKRTFKLTVTYRFNESKSKYKGTASTDELKRL